VKQPERVIKKLAYKGYQNEQFAVLAALAIEELAGNSNALGIVLQNLQSASLRELVYALARVLGPEEVARRAMEGPGHD
jgi:hypothetical protein